MKPLLRLLVLGCFCIALPALGKSYPYQRCFEIASDMHDVPLELLLAVAATESNWDPDARSSANAHGVMQIQWPGTARHLGVRRVAELYNPCLNISLGAQYLAQLAREFPDDEWRLAAYNYGPTRIKTVDALPDGARAYAARVAAHRERIRQGFMPAKLTRTESQTLVTFDSKTRANRLARQLTESLDGASASVERRSRLLGGYAVILAVGSSGLSVRDHVTLTNLGLAR